MPIDKNRLLRLETEHGQIWARAVEALRDRAE